MAETAPPEITRPSQNVVNRRMYKSESETTIPRFDPGCTTSNIVKETQHEYGINWVMEAMLF
eukprot:1090947-Amorphochlora_amoeboformis.AAC.1